MKELTQHQTNELNLKLKVHALGERSAGGAFSFYEIGGFDTDKHPLTDFPIHNRYLQVYFQDGPIAEVGCNGITDEALLAILADRLRDFQNGPFENKHNGAALACIEQALAHLQARTLERQARGVEGTHGL